MYPVSRRSQRLELRELTLDDVDAVFAIYGSHEATEHLSFEPRTREDVGHILARSIASATERPRTEYALAVVERSARHLIGFGRLAGDPHQQQAATMGFALHPDAWGAGLGTETVHLLLCLGFEDQGLHRIWGARSPLNEASARTMLRAGMVEEGRIREHVQKNGRWRDSIVHAALSHEWDNPSLPDEAG
ncbi:GNAT family N-acetyltransferase [Streptomyces sp. I05A-00742]|uniref:GNAT family N-acetyltransferase n=1 Tax=Streptomyces sp. I05A-00742 TaxID=2732853 RepID=UPI00148910CE|nr:GNAT family protein [Streptomyces sp. I05A-00742]